MRSANGHTVEWVKRLAKKIKRAKGITHTQALDEASVECGFHNYKHFLNQINKQDNEN